MDKYIFPCPGKHLRGAEPCVPHAAPAVAPTGTTTGNRLSLWTTGQLCQQFPQSYAQGPADKWRSHCAGGLFSRGSGSLHPFRVACSLAMACRTLRGLLFSQACLRKPTWPLPLACRVQRRGPLRPVKGTGSSFFPAGCQVRCPVGRTGSRSVDGPCIRFCLLFFNSSINQ